MYLLDSHIHSIASGHGSNSMIHQLALEASKKGLQMICITDHGPKTLGSATESYFRNLQFAARKHYNVDLLYGCEVNILDESGTVDLSQELLSQLDYVIASFHTQNIKPGNISQNTKTLLQVMDNPYIHAIGHPDDVKYPVNFKAIVEYAKQTHTLLELNEASLDPNGYRGDTKANNIELLHWCAHYEHPIVLGSDSHGTKTLGNFTQCDKLLNAIDFPKHLILNSDSRSFLNFIHTKKH